MWLVFICQGGGVYYRSAVIGSSTTAVVAVAVSLSETGEANKTTSF